MRFLVFIQNSDIQHSIKIQNSLCIPPHNLNQLSTHSQVQKETSDQEGRKKHWQSSKKTKKQIDFFIV